MSEWKEIAKLNDIPVRGARVIKTANGCIGIFRTHKNRVFAIDDACPHKKASLSEGLVHGDAVTCPMHNWVIDLNSGKALGADEGSVKTYKIKVENEIIYLDISRINDLKD